MKNLLAAMLACVLLVSLAGCRTSGPKVDPDIAPLAMTPGETSTGYDGVEIQLGSLSRNEMEQVTLTVTWNNQTEYDAIYGSSYIVERLEGNEWVSCAVLDNIAFDAIAYELKAGQSREETYFLTQIYDVSTPGTYRFRTDCFVQDNAEQGTKYDLTAEFTLGNGKYPEGSKETGTDVQWCAQYIRTNGSSEAVRFPGVRIIGSLRELKDYYNMWHEVFDLERKEKVYADTTIGFLDACDRYDEAFFESNCLIFVLLEEGSGSVRHEVRSVELSADKKLAISVDRKVPEVGTDDMAQWHIILELKQDAMVESTTDIMLFVDGKPFFMDNEIVIPQTEGKYKAPPKATIFTPEGETTLQAAGYSWFCTLGSGLEEAVIADQADRPLPEGSLEPVFISSKYAETVYSKVPGSDAYAPTNSLGYLVKLGWEVNPSSVSYTCWPEAVWQDDGIQEAFVVAYEDFSFYAKHGGYIYEIAAEWEDTGSGYHGTANYYVYITDEDLHMHAAALNPQTVSDPISGYCGNTWTTLYIDGEEYGFMGSQSVALTDILVNLDYNPAKVCRCMPQYRADTEFGTNYHIHLDYGFIRCDKGQAELTVEQINTIAEIIAWAEKQK